MALRFRKSTRLLPGVRLNINPRGISASFGPRAANLNLDKKGVYAKGGIPGTGLSAHQRLTGGKRKGPLSSLLGRFFR